MTDRFDILIQRGFRRWLIHWTNMVVLLVSGLVTAGCAGKAEVDSRLFERKAKCREDGDKTQAAWKSWYAGGGQNWSKYDEYAYNPALNTCLWSGEYFSPVASDIWRDPAAFRTFLSGATHYKLVLDVYANKILIDFGEAGDKQLGNMSEVEFDRRKAELMGSALQTGRPPTK